MAEKTCTKFDFNGSQYELPPGMIHSLPTSHEIAGKHVVSNTLGEGNFINVVIEYRGFPEFITADEARALAYALLMTADRCETKEPPCPKS